MTNFPESLIKIIRALQSLPEIGPKMAQRISFHILNWKKEELEEFLNNIKEGYLLTKHCKICNNFSDKEICDICNDPKREKDKICIIEEPQDINNIEKTHTYNGLYHVLGGVLKPLDGISLNDLNVNNLIKRLENSKVKEILIALNPNPESEATALYIKKVIKEKFPEIKITRLARGLPLGTEIEYADEVTLKEAIEERKEL